MWQLVSVMTYKVGTLMELQLTWQCPFPWLWACFDCCVDNVKPKSFKTERPRVKMKLFFHHFNCFFMLLTQPQQCVTLFILFSLHKMIQWLNILWCATTTRLIGYKRAAVVRKLSGLSVISYFPYVINKSYWIFDDEQVSRPYPLQLLNMTRLSVLFEKNLWW